MPPTKKPTRNATRKTKAKTIGLGVHVRESILILSLVVACFLSVALLGQQLHPYNSVGGWLGTTISHGLFEACGLTAYWLPLSLLYGGWLVFRTKIILPQQDYPHVVWRVTGFVCILLSLTAIFDIGLDQDHLIKGGLIGTWFSELWLEWLGQTASVVFLLGLLLVGISLFTGLSWSKTLERMGKILLFCILGVSALCIHWHQRWQKRRLTRTLAKPIVKKSKESGHTRDKKAAAQLVPPVISAPIKTAAPSQRASSDRQSNLFKALADTTVPSLNLLDPAEISQAPQLSKAMLETMSRQVEARLLEFNIDVQVVAVHPGPVITRFEMQLAPGIKVSRITTLAKDLARSLSVISVRIVEVIPGKATVGFEVPNEHREIVRLSEVLASQAYDLAKSPVSLALGKDISGHPVIVDLAKMPHLLVAGTTGSGKSVGLNAMILSLLFKATPSEVRLIMIDPKMLELSIYEGIPHLLTPVVTDMRDAANALRWCVVEMDRRYKLMAALGVRNLASFNAKIREAEKAGTPLLDPLWKSTGLIDDVAPALSPLPWIVVIVDEFADMIMVVGKKVEELIARIAQKARAAGIHMILATQRPSVDVITGLIKANVPTRIAFQVSSRIDSRTILDQQGAEQLLGHGDMLYLAPGTGLPIRVHGAFVDDAEVHRVVADWRGRGEPEYWLDLSSFSDGSDPDKASSSDDPNSEADPLYDQAVQIVIESRRASISNLQRRLKVGYNRSARLIEAMEAAGLVSPMESNGNRQVLVPEHHA